MSVTVAELPDGNELGLANTIEWTDRGPPGALVHYRVTGHTGADDEVAVAAGVPRRGSAHPRWGGLVALADARLVRRVGPGNHIVALRYGVPQQNNSDAPVDALGTRVPYLRVGQVKQTRPVVRDTSGALLGFTAQVPANATRFTVVSFHATGGWLSDWLGVQNTVNTQPVAFPALEGQRDVASARFTLAAGQVIAEEMGGTRVIDGGVVAVEFNFLVGPAGFAKAVGEQIAGGTQAQSSPKDVIAGADINGAGLWDMGYWA